MGASVPAALLSQSAGNERVCRSPFRWKGENVATTEVAETLGLLDFVQEVNVYGVEVPGRTSTHAVCTCAPRLRLW